MSNFWKALEQLEEPKKVKYEYRLYYDKETGDPLFYSMEDLEGDYIVIDKDQFAECRYDVRVKDGKIERIKGVSIGKLVPSTEGYGTRADDVSLVGDEQCWSLKTYE